MRTRRAAPEESERTARNARMKKLTAVAEAFKSFRPASEVLTRVRAVPTIFPQFDDKTKVGGLPIERFTLLHGPSGGGKTYVSIAMLLSFLMKDHFAVLIDAERTTPITWLENAMGEYAQHPFFKAKRPETYEQTVQDVRHFLNTLRKQRESGQVSPDTSALIVVDSIRKLVPKDNFDRLMKDVKARGDKDEKVRDRTQQMKAAMNAAWMDEVVILLEQTQSAMIVIARETDDPNADPNAKKWGQGWITGGGKALFYDASLDLRSSLVKLYGKKVGDPPKLTPYGDLHRLEITKSKVSGKGEDYRASCTYHISNGVWTPRGFDRARDLVDFARRIDVIEGTSWLKFGRHKFNGEDRAVKDISQNATLFAAIEAECRAFSASNQETTR